VRTTFSPIQNNWTLYLTNVSRWCLYHIIHIIEVYGYRPIIVLCKRSALTRLTRQLFPLFVNDYNYFCHYSLKIENCRRLVKWPLWILRNLNVLKISDSEAWHARSCPQVSARKFDIVEYRRTKERTPVLPYCSSLT